MTPSGASSPNGLKVDNSVAVCMKNGTFSLNPVAFAAFRNGTQPAPPVAMMTASGLAERIDVIYGVKSGSPTFHQD